MSRIVHQHLYAMRQLYGYGSVYGSHNRDLLSSWGLDLARL